MNNNNKSEFIDVYIYLFGGTKKAAEKVYKTANKSYISVCIETFEHNAKAAFYHD